MRGPARGHHSWHDAHWHRTARARRDWLFERYWPIAAALFPVGIGLGLITGPIATVAVANAPAARSGMSSGLVNVGRMVGATWGSRC